MAICGHFGDVEPAPVILDDEPHPFRGGDEPDGYASGSRVLAYVREGLLADAVQGHLHTRQQRAAAVHRPVARADARLRLPPLHEGLERLGERPAFERGGPEVQHRAAGLFEVGAGEGERAAQWFVRLLRTGVQQGVG